MRPLIIDSIAKEKIAKVIDHAKQNIFSVDDILDVMNKEKSKAGDSEGFTVVIPIGYTCVFSYENQPIGLARHLSISVDEPHKMPNVESVKEIMNQFGFESVLAQCIVGIENIDESHSAISIAELVKVSN